jgi:hypothetical protein
MVAEPHRERRKNANRRNGCYGYNGFPMRLRGAERDHVYQWQTGQMVCGGANRIPCNRVPSRKDGQVTKTELIHIFQIAFIGAIVAVAVQHFVEPAAKHAVKAR